MNEAQQNHDPSIHTDLPEIPAPLLSAKNDATTDKQHHEQHFLDETLAKRERKIRRDAVHNAILLAPVNFVAALVVFIMHIVSLEIDSPESLDGSIMDFVLLSFAVIIPLSNTVQMAFRRREQALSLMASFRATEVEIFLSHASWDWNQVPGNSHESGRTKSTVDWAEHASGILDELLAIANEMARYLTLPSSTRARHKSLSFFVAEARNTQAVADELHKSVVKRMAIVADYCEILKREGIPGNEAARIRQWERFLLDYIEKLRMLKMYRTPQALRSFGRLFSLLLPAFYCPFFAEMSYKLNSLPFGIAFAVIASVALTGLFETVSQFEDPFAAEASVLDGIHVHEELVGNLTPQLLMLMDKYFSTAAASVRLDELQLDAGPPRTGVRFLGE
ncbi:hypothetical protein MPSEU_000962000 [Mayamaea pseudoterrestris]|nr:hypothetical protein MPSEU_000962000 [Mayamaea pseudoterrestris]